MFPSRLSILLRYRVESLLVNVADLLALSVKLPKNSFRILVAVESVPQKEQKAFAISHFNNAMNPL